jgi:tRNA G18 (ribose-2'-O)-methylase SpoU
LTTTSGAVGVEGVRLVEEALTSGCPVEAVLFSESAERYRDRLAPLVGRPETGFPVLRTTDRLFEGIADTEHPQGVAALVVPRAATLEQMVKAELAGPAFRSGPFLPLRKIPQRAEAHFSLSSKSELKLRPPNEKRDPRPTLTNPRTQD